MRPVYIHLAFLAVLAVLGIALYAMEALSPYDGGGFLPQYLFSQLYGLAWIGYALLSTVIVAAVGLTFKIRQRPVTEKTVLLSHVIPIGLIWLFFRLGIHDMIQDAWSTRSSALTPDRQQVRTEQTQSARPPIPTAPLSKHLDIKEAGKPVAPTRQEAAPP